jgi:septum formation protein
MHTSFYLASNSPRRIELLQQIKAKFEILPPLHTEATEEKLPGESPNVYLKRVCLAKLKAAQQQLPSNNTLPILTADTIVCQGATILGKPKDAEHAKEILQDLSATRHRVLTGVCLHSGTQTEVIIVESIVQFRRLTTEEIDKYIQSGEGMDKAGGYAIQGKAAIFIEKIEGSYSCIKGLPLMETYQLLQKFDIQCFE